MGIHLWKRNSNTPFASIGGGGAVTMVAVVVVVAVAQRTGKGDGTREWWKCFPLLKKQKTFSDGAYDRDVCQDKL